MTESVTIFLAFGAGLLSFFSPCILPLIPSYLAVIGGVPLKTSAVRNKSADEPDNEPLNGELKPQVVARTLSFVLGFSVVFIVLSIVLSASFSLMGDFSIWVSRIAGLIVIVLGLNVLFDFLSFLNYEKRFHFKGRTKGIAGALLAGGAFGAGWTPCVGPVLAGILLLAAQSGGIPKAILLLVFYSAGLGLPFLFAAIFFNVFLKASAKIRTHLQLIRRISGGLLVVIGVLMLSGQYQALNALTIKWQNNLTSAKNSSAQPDNAPLAVTDASMSSNAVPAEVLNAFKAAKLPTTPKGIDPPAFTLPMLDGTRLSLADLKGKVVFLNFWATWCGPCRMEMPSMEAVYQQLRDDDFEMIAVNLREDPATIAAFMQANNLTFPVALDRTGSTGSLYSVQAIPSTYIIDKRGYVVSRMVGAINWNTPEIIAALKSLW